MPDTTALEKQFFTDYWSGEKQNKHSDYFALFAQSG